MSTTQIVLQGQGTVTPTDLYMSFEFSDKKWQLTLSDGRRSPSRYSVDAGDTDAAMQCIAKAKERCKLDPAAKVHSCYEAGRDGWWLQSWLVEHGIDNIVVGSSSIEVNRHARRAKTDQIDGDKLLSLLLHRVRPKASCRGAVGKSRTVRWLYTGLSCGQVPGRRRTRHLNCCKGLVTDQIHRKLPTDSPDEPQS
ncbi:MAG: hypothetical protein WCH35_07335 [Comamonadaceae bacterium]